MVSLRATFRELNKKLVASAAVFALVLQPTYVIVSSHVASATGGIEITNVAELRDAIENQADGQVWNIHSGVYGLAPFNDITAGGQTGWYFPIVKDDITINGIGNPVIYGTGFSANGNWATQDLVAVFGDDVTIDGFTFMPKVEPNKTIEVLGEDFTLRNTTIEPNTIVDPSEYDGIANPQDRQDEKEWGGSLYFNHAGNHVIKNVTIKNAGISYRYSPSDTHIKLNNVKLDYTTNVDWINGYRYSTGFNNAGNTVTGSPKVTYHVSSALNNLDSVLANVKDGDTIVLDSNLNIDKQLTLTKAVTFDGKNHKLKPTFAKTDNGNNSALGIQSDDVTVKRLVVDGVNGTNLHGVNVFESSNVNLNKVTSKNNDRSGVGVNGSTVTVTNLTTANNGWHGVNVDKPGAVLTVNGISHHNDVLPIYVDDRTVGQVVDTNNQYGHKDDVLTAGDRVYGLKPAVPTLEYPLDNALINTNNFWFDWNDADGAASYEVQYALNPAIDADGGFQNVAWTGDYQGVQPTDSKAHSVGANGTWYWQVRTVDALGIKSNWSPVWKMTIDMAAPDTPVLTSPADGVVTKGASITQSWSDASSDVDHYIYESYNDAGATSLRWHQEFSSTSKTATNVADTTYWWRVKAVDAAGNESAWSPLWKIVVDNTVPDVTFGGYVQSGNVILPSFTATDANGPLTYSWTTDPNVTLSATDALNPTFTTSADGDYAFTLTVTDAAGNTKDVTFNFSYAAPVTPVDNGSTDNSDNNDDTSDGDGTTNNGFTNVNTNANNTSDDATDDSDVLGTSTEKKDDSNSEVKGASDTAKSDSKSWSLADLAWYWWLAILAVIALIGWLISVLRRRAAGNA